MADELINTKEAARILGVTPTHARRYCATGQLPCRKVGRDWLIRRVDVERFVRPPAGRRPSRPREGGGHDGPSTDR